MRNVLEALEVPVKYKSSEGSWFQITFTLDPGQYRALRERAQAEGLTIPGFVRDSVMDSLNDGDVLSRKNEWGCRGTTRRS